jgi:hypothetical protein
MEKLREIKKNKGIKGEIKRKEEDRIIYELISLL